MYRKWYRKKVIESADHIITASNLITDYFARRYKKDKIDTITNGFDSIYFKEGEVFYKKNKKFTIVQTDSLQKTNSRAFL